jgi:hypothetical protein
MITVVLLSTSPSLAGECPPGMRADQSEVWPILVGAAISDAEEYAIKNNPAAGFMLAKARVHYQIAGEHAGQYVVQLTAKTSYGVAFARLLPKFDFCADPTGYSDTYSGLFRVVSAKLNGRQF